MLTSQKRRKLSHEILGIAAVTLLLALFLFWFLWVCASGIVESYCFRLDMVLSEIQQAQIDQLIIHVSLLISVAFFFLLLLALLGERLAYIRTLTQGIDALRRGESPCTIPVEGNNELTQLAEAIHYLSETQQQVRLQEQALAEEKAQLIRSLSHDIRTPLTSILSFSELAAAQDAPISREYPLLVLNKARQIQALTDILLDGGARKPEHFSDIRLLLTQLAEELEASLETQFRVETELTLPHPISGQLDVQEMLRIFNNLISNIEKYGDSAFPVTLSIAADAQGIVIRQSNTVAAQPKTVDGYHVGLQSIRAIAQNYGGKVQTDSDGKTFTITVSLLEF